MEVILGKPKSDTQSSGSDDDIDQTADDDADSDGEEEEDQVAANMIFCFYFLNK